jgi:hypothetical protein
MSSLIGYCNRGFRGAGFIICGFFFGSRFCVCFCIIRVVLG